MKITLAIIAKDEVKACKEIIEKYKNYFDEIVIAGDMVHDDFGALTGMLYGVGGRVCYVKYYQYKWKNDFSDKRNFLAKKIQTEYYVRMDTDDELVGVENLPEILKKAEEQNIDVVYCLYDYAKDKDGNTVAEHWRETVIKKRDGLYWKGRVHESMFWDDETTARNVKDETLYIKHNIDEAHIKISSERNLEILLQEYNEDRENCDPRTLSYIGRSFLGMGYYKEAIVILEKFIKVSGWEEDKYFALCNLSDAYLRTGNIKSAIECALLATGMFPHHPDAYLKLGTAYLDKNDFKKAIHWYDIGARQKKPDTLVVLDPSFYGWVTKLNMGLCYLGLGDAETAWTFYKMAKEEAPNAEGVISMEKTFTKALVDNKFFYHLTSLTKMVDKMDRDKLKFLASAIPSSLMSDERAFLIRNKCLPPETWDKDSVVIYCGGAFEDWADPSTHLGIGGSEEAVIYMSRELTKLGKKVTVFNQCGDLAGEWNGVTYKNWYEFNRQDRFETIIFWRGIPFEVKGKNRIVWMHDVPCGTFHEGNKTWYDKVFVLSEFHKSLVAPFVDSSKIVVTRNGINLEDTANTSRQPKRCIYTSSYDRGLEHLLDIWQEVRKEVPEAELHIFYGWNTYDKMVEIGMRTPDFKEHLNKKMNQEGVFEHGRVGHAELAEEFAKADLYVYPSHFEEISCISAMKAQAYGAIPITTDYAALKETVKYGFKVEGRGNEVTEAYKEKLIDCLRNDYSSMRDVMLANKDQWTWTNVASEWMKHL